VLNYLVRISVCSIFMHLKCMFTQLFQSRLIFIRKEWAQHVLNLFAKETLSKNDPNKLIKIK